MPATDWTPSQRKLLALWGPISSAVLARADTATLWQTIRDAADRFGVSDLRPTLADVNAVRHLAVVNRASTDRLARALPEYGITGAMIGQTPLARDLADQARSPEFLVRYPHLFTVEGREETHWMSSIITGSLEGFTKESLLDLVNADAETWSLDYDVQHVGVGDIEILAR